MLSRRVLIRGMVLGAWFMTDGDSKVEATVNLMELQIFNKTGSAPLEFVINLSMSA